MPTALATRPPSRTTQLDHHLFGDDDGPSPDELVAFDGETTAAFAARTGLPEPERLGLTDSVPVFRGDLQIGKGAATGLFEVGDPSTGRHFTLYEFELSIARMLDGRRHASDVIENGVRLGIPVDLDGLNKFIRQLWRYGFLAQPGAAPAPVEGEETGWGERVKWDEATRTLFQTGLRLMRQGRPADAESYFHAVLDADPSNEDAKELLAAVARGDSLAAAPIGRRAAPVKARPRLSGARVALAAGSVALVAAAAAAGVFLQQRPRIRITQGPPQPPIVLPAAPQGAAPGAPPGVLPGAPRTPPGAPAGLLPGPPARPTAWRTAAVLRREPLRVAELAAPADGTVLWKRKAGEGVKQGDRIGTLRRRAGRGARELALTAPGAGALALAVADRAAVRSGAPLASVVDPRVWIVEAFADGEPPASDAACELRGDAVERLPCKVEGRRPREGGSELTIRAEAEAAPWVGSSRSLRVRLAPAGTPPEPAPHPPR